MKIVAIIDAIPSDIALLTKIPFEPNRGARIRTDGITMNPYLKNDN